MKKKKRLTMLEKWIKYVKEVDRKHKNWVLAQKCWMLIYDMVWKSTPLAKDGSNEVNDNANNEDERQKHE
jgi:hypothetical protein